MSLPSILQKHSHRLVSLSTRQPLRRLMSSSPRTDAVKNMQELFNSQITKEMNASQLYLSASIWFAEQELTGMANYARRESSEERGHAMEMIDFGLKRDYPIDLEPLPAPHAHWPSTEALWIDLLEAEKENSASLYSLADAAHTCQDHALVTFLQSFHTEQVDAVADLKTVVAKVKEEGRTPGLIRQLDNELGSAPKPQESI